MATKKSRPSTVSARLQEERADQAETIDEILGLRKHAAEIISDGFGGHRERLWESVLYDIVERQTAKERRALDELMARIDKAHPGALRFPEQGAHVGDLAGEHASDVVVGIATRWADTGFQLGIAVGMQLGPHAFDRNDRGGAR